MRQNQVRRSLPPHAQFRSAARSRRRGPMIGVGRKDVTAPVWPVPVDRYQCGLRAEASRRPAVALKDHDLPFPVRRRILRELLVAAEIGAAGEERDAEGRGWYCQSMALRAGHFFSRDDTEISGEAPPEPCVGRRSLLVELARRGFRYSKGLNTEDLPQRVRHVGFGGREPELARFVARLVLSTEALLAADLHQEAIL